MKRAILWMLCLALGGLVLGGCSYRGEPFVPKEYTAPMPQIKGIKIDARDRQIEVSVWEEEEVRIAYFESSREAYDIAVSEEGELTMTRAGGKAWTDYIGGKPPAENRKISLQIPGSLLENLTLSTTNEDISLLALAVTESASISSNGGNIIFESLNAGKALTLSVKNGDISGTIAGSYEDFSIRSEIKKGRSNLPENKNGGEKALNVSCNHGDVHILFEKGEAASG